MEVLKAAYMKAVQSMYSVPHRTAAKAALEEDTTLQEQVDGTYDWLSVSNTAKEKLRTQSDGYLFASRNELNQYLEQNFPAFKSGMVSVSKKYLNDCLSDPEKLASLEDTLDAIPGMLEDIKANLHKDTKLLSCTFSIDDEGNLTVETSSSSVAFNAAKRAAELSGAVTSSDVSLVLTKLQQDLADVKAGGCEEDTIKLVKNMIKRAEEKFHRLREKEMEAGKLQGTPAVLPPNSEGGAIFTPSPAEDIAFSTTLYQRS